MNYSLKHLGVYSVGKNSNCKYEGVGICAREREREKIHSYYINILAFQSMISKHNISCLFYLLDYFKINNHHLRAYLWDGLEYFLQHMKYSNI